MKITENKLVALLRAVNVGGHSVIKMSELQKMFESLDLSNVVTYIQSGNVIFSTKEKDFNKLALLIENKIKSTFNYETTVFIFSHDDLNICATNNPYEPEKYTLEKQCHMMFLTGIPKADNCNSLMKLQGEEYKFHINGKVLYYSYFKKYSGHRRNIDFEKLLDVKGTARTWKVVKKLIELSN